MSGGGVLHHHQLMCKCFLAVLVVLLNENGQFSMKCLNFFLFKLKKKTETGYK